MWYVDYIILWAIWWTASDNQWSADHSLRNTVLTGLWGVYGLQQGLSYSASLSFPPIMQLQPLFHYFLPYLLLIPTRTTETKTNNTACTGHGNVMFGMTMLQVSSILSTVVILCLLCHMSRCSGRFSLAMIFTINMPVYTELLGLEGNLGRVRVNSSRECGGICFTGLLYVASVR
jgi:hypothetical protein